MYKNCTTTLVGQLIGGKYLLTYKKKEKKIFPDGKKMKKYLKENKF